MLTNTHICSHVEEIRSALAAGLTQTEITDSQRGLLQDWVDRTRKVIEERGVDMAGVPGGSTVLLVKD